MNEDMKLILDAINNLKSEIKGLTERFDKLESKVDSLDAKIECNYSKSLDMLGFLEEHHTESTDSFAWVEGMLKMHNNQIAKNTSDISRLRRGK